MVAAITAIDQPDTLLKQASGTATTTGVSQAIKLASARTGVDFSYLLNKANQESGMDPNAKASNSSATGLFQFTSQTWLSMVKDHGAEYGLGQYADHITTDKNGIQHVSDPHWRKAILSMRKDPTISAEMAGELDKENMGTLKSDVGGKIGPTELYLAHFLGAGGASDFLNTMKGNPNATAANVLPDAAAANRSIFYDKSGAPKSIKQVYQQFAQKFNRAPALPDDIATTAVASAAPVSAPSSSSIGSFNVASAASVTSPVSGIGATKLPAQSSLYTAMVIAQLGMKNMTDTQLSKIYSTNDEHKKNNILTATSLIS